MGAGTVFSLQFGAGKYEKLRQSIFVSFIFIGIITLALNAVAFIFLDETLVWLQVPGDVEPLVLQFLYVMIDRRREAAIVPAIDGFIDLARAAQNIEVAKVRVVKALTAAEEEKIPLQKGVYLQTTGPNFESPAEIRMYSVLGADAVGMSTACEAVAARHAGVRICGISCISNMASGISEEELSHLDVQSVADKRAGEFERLVTKSIEKIGEHIG